MPDSPQPAPPHPKRTVKSVRLTAPRYWNLMGTQCLLTLLFLLSLSVTLWMVMQYQREMMLLMGKDFPADSLTTQKVYIRIFWFQIIFFLVGTLALFGLACHRIAGTYLAMKRTFEKIREGDTSARLSFRGTDQLEDVAESFNRMMDTLEPPAKNTTESES